MTLTELFNNVFNPTDNTVTNLEDVDFGQVSKEELDETMEALDGIKENPIMSLIISKYDIDDIKAEIQAKWDMAHDEGKELPTEDETKLPEGVEEQLKKLVDEYIDEKLKFTEGSTLGALIAPYAKSGYLDFARFIYTHK